MPRYDFRCCNCKNRFEIKMAYEEYGVKDVICPHCGSGDAERFIRNVRLLRSEGGRVAEFDQFAGMDDLAAMEENPRELGRMMKKMSSELGEEMPPEFNEVVDRLESGQKPEDIEKELPDYGIGDA